MKTFPSDIRFQYPWRKYQQRVLDALEEHLSDKHLHIIAPPGSGKTVLGLEVVLRINQPTLILAPTLAIRNQWIQRFCELFLQTYLPPAWISRDIRQPGLLTVVTYQGLHAACNNLTIQEEESEEEENEPAAPSPEKSSNRNLEAIVEGLKNRQVKTIVADEAHHLKNEWWATLIQVKERIDPVVVGLTATPPYDVSPLEWQRYLELTGPVDTEISVPELIIEGDLCPHQDYVYFSFPTRSENEKILSFRDGAYSVFREIKTDETLIGALSGHPAWIDPLKNLEWIYNNLPFYSATLIFLHANEIEIPETHLEIIGDKHLQIPPLDYTWMETLLDFYLYKGQGCFDVFENARKSLENRLKRCGALERRQIKFGYNTGLAGYLTSSLSKLESVKAIVDFEYQCLKHELRLLILTDYIRKEYLVNSPENTLELNKIGAIPLFERLRRENADGKKIGVLTGSIVILPVSAFEVFEQKAQTVGIPQILATPVPYDSRYVVIRQTEQLKHDIIHLVTDIFQRGEIEILIGTKSLLGEGWDAPAINALILASFVGSFVSSNQMRGRAIRTQKENPGKTGNIWHLACVDPGAPAGGIDVSLLKRRFKTFVGIAVHGEPGIENGTGRLGIPEQLHQPDVVDAYNAEVFRMAGDRASLQQRWDAALQTGVTLVEEIKIPFKKGKPYRREKRLYYRKTIASLFGTLAFGLLGFFGQALQSLLHAIGSIKNIEDFYIWLLYIGTAGVALFGGLTYKTFRLYVKYRDIAKDIQKIGEALLNTLVGAGIFRTDPAKLNVFSALDESSAVFCHLEGGTAFEKSTFINTLQEIIGPLRNPRYVVVRKSRFLFFIRQVDFHALPEILARNKPLAEYFCRQWRARVGPCDLIFTRSIEGRKLLLTARARALAAQFEDDTEHVNVWR